MSGSKVYSCSDLIWYQAVEKAKKILDRHKRELPDTPPLSLEDASRKVLGMKVITDLTRDLVAAILKGSKEGLQARDQDGYPIKLESADEILMGLGTIFLSPIEANAWLEAEGRNYKWIPSTSIKPRTTPFRAFLQTCFQSGVGKNIESVWLHMRNNAGKNNFLFKTVARTTATTIDDMVVKKDALARTLAGLIKQANK